MPRTANNPRTGLVLLNAFKPVLPPNTRFASLSTSGTGLERIYIQEKYKMAQGDFPALLLTCGEQVYTYAAYGREGTIAVNVFYYDRWDQQSLTMDAILNNMAADLDLMQANVENDDSVISGNAATLTGIPEIRQSPYEGYLEQPTTTGVVLIYRVLTLQCTILPYDC